MDNSSLVVRCINYEYIEIERRGVFLKKCFKLGLVFLLLVTFVGCEKTVAKKSESSRAELYTLEWTLEAGQDDKIIFNEVGEEFLLKYMTGKVNDVLVSTNINDVYRFADKHSADLIFDDIMGDFGPKGEVTQLNGVEYIGEDGELNKGFKQLIFLSVTISSGSRGFVDISLTPSGYKKNGDTYSYIHGLESYATNNEQHTDPHEKFLYTFNGGEEKEFVIALMSRDDLSGEDVYIDADFIVPASTVFDNEERTNNPNRQLHRGTHFIHIIKSSD